MADNEQSKVRYDDFVGRVQADPASPQSTIMLAGYAGHGPEGHIRIYPDPTLGNWYDVPAADIVHSMPIEDSKLGGSYVWIRSSAAIKPGNAAPPAPAAAPVAAAPNLQPTPTAQTHCFICPPLTQHCTVAPQCPPPSLHCPSSPIVCDTHPSLGIACTVVPQCPPPTPLHGCPPPPPTPFCPHTPLQGCPPPTPFCPSHPIICTHTQLFACPITHPPGCPVPTQQPGLCPVVSNPAVCGPQFTTPQLTTPQFTPQFGQGGVPQAQLPQAQLPQAQAFAGPAPAAAPQAGAAAQQPFSQHICPTPSAVHQCGGPQQSLAVICTQVFICGQSIPPTQCGCLTPAIVCTPPHQISQQVVCQTPTGQITQQVFCQQSLGIACLQSVQTPCFPQTFGACPSIACTPQLTPVQNGVFTPFGR